MIVLVDDHAARRFEPFATSRPFSEMRAGALLTRERWARVLGAGAVGFVAAPHLDGFAEFEAPPCVNGGALASGTWIVNSRALPFLSADAPTVTGAAWTITVEGRVAARRLRVAMPAATDEAILAALADDADPPHDGGAATAGGTIALGGVWIDEVWDLIRTLPSVLLADIPAIAARLSTTTITAAAPPGPGGASPYVTGAHALYVEAGAFIEPMSVFDTSAGPVLVRRGSQVQAFTRVIGPCYIGCDSVVTTDRIACSSIGDQCRVHGELSTTILVGHANKGHDGFVGHSVLGRWVNLGAGTITSNLKNTYGTVALWTPDGVRDTGLQFLGTLFGDHVKTGIGLRLTTGCVLGAGANVFDAMPPKVVPPFAWGGRAPYDAFDGGKFVQTATRMMARRAVTLSESAGRWWREIYRTSEADARWPRR